MTRSLKSKMILSYLAVAFLTVLLVSVLIRLTSGRSLMSLVVEEQTASLKEMGQTYYTSSGTLGGFFEYYIQASRDHRPPPETDSLDKPPENHSVRGVAGLVDTEYRALFPTLGYDVGEVVPQERVKQSIAVEVNGETVAWILPDTSWAFSLSPEEELFLQRTTQAIGLAALAGVLAAVGRGGAIRLGVKVDEQIHLQVEDSGEGIDAEDLPYVFDRFYRADKARSINVDKTGFAGKMGLGLAICKALVTAQGGAIKAVSPGKGQGTTIIITF